MPKRKIYTGVGVTPGELYREIKVPREEFVEEEVLKVRRIPPFVRFCRNVNKRFPSFGKGAKFTEEFKNAIAFLDWDLKPEEFSGTVKAVMIFSLIAAFGLSFIISFSPLGAIITETTRSQFITLFYVLTPLILAALGLTYYVQSYPLSQAKAEQVRALTYIPEIVGYMTMSMKLVPNLEKAMEFAATHGKGKIAFDLKKMIWDVQIGLYATLSEALDELAYRWGRFSSEFKEALMMIRASVLETTEPKRYALLDKTMESVLTSIREKMENYARGLAQPSIVLFYIGVLLPLILIIVLPIGSSFTGQPLARADVLVLLYNIFLPGATFGFAYYVLKKRPPTYKPPVIPDTHPKLFGKYKMKLGKSIVDVRVMVVVVFLAGLLASFFLSTQGIPPKFMIEEGAPQILAADRSQAEVLASANLAPDYFDEGGVLEQRLISRGTDPVEAREIVLQEKSNFYFQPENDISPYLLTFGTVFTISLCLAFFLYFTSIYKKKIQDDFVQMETEFKDSLYVLASRLGENKPVEEALKHTKEFLPTYLISSEVFDKTLNNISLMGFPLEQALFDPTYGSLKDNPSTLLRGSFRLLVDSVRLGVNVAARTLMSLSMQITNSEKVTKMLRVLVSEITGMMTTMSVFVAPIVLGITASLQKVVMVTLSQIAAGPVSPTGPTLPLDIAAAGVVGGEFMGAFQGFTQATRAFALDRTVLATLADPTQFLLIVALYVIELVMVMIYFTTKIEEDNNLKVKLNIAMALPVSVFIFLVTLLIANNVVGAFF